MRATHLIAQLSPLLSLLLAMSSPSSPPPPNGIRPRTVLIVGSSGNVGTGVARAFRIRGTWNVICVDPAASEDVSAAPPSPTDERQRRGRRADREYAEDRHARQRSKSASLPRARPRVAGWVRRGTGSERFRPGSLGSNSMKGASDLVKEVFGDLVGDGFDFDDLSCTSSDEGGDGSSDDEESGSAASGSSPETRRLVRSKFIEEITPEEFRGWFAPASRGGWECREVVYAAEEGNRDLYEERPQLGEENDARFAAFVERAADTLREDCGGDGRRLHISYIGGSWTRRSMDASTLIVSDGSPVKTGDGDNPYEFAKTAASQNARFLASILGRVLSITFYDYISVVPNYAPNFSVGKMVRSALEEGVIRYSEGDYGRPLLHQTQAGVVVAKMAERQTEAGTNGRGDEAFDAILVPGAFTPFSAFAAIARNVVLQSGKRTEVELRALPDPAPDFLRARCVSDRLREEIGFEPDECMVGEGLTDAAVRALEDLVGETVGREH